MTKRNEPDGVNQTYDELVIQGVNSVDSTIPVVVLTGSKQGLKRIESSAPAADVYIEKQTDLQAYIDILRSCWVEQ